MQITVSGAHTTFPNTPETDSIPEVWHTVEYSTDDNQTGTAYIQAKDPMDAIKKMQHMQLEEVQAKYSTSPHLQMYGPREKMQIEKQLR